MSTILLRLSASQRADRFRRWMDILDGLYLDGRIDSAAYVASAREIRQQADAAVLPLRRTA